MWGGRAAAGWITDDDKNWSKKKTMDRKTTLDGDDDDDLKPAAAEGIIVLILRWWRRRRRWRWWNNSWDEQKSWIKSDRTTAGINRRNQLKADRAAMLPYGLGNHVRLWGWRGAHIKTHSQTVHTASREHSGERTTRGGKGGRGERRSRRRRRTLRQQSPSMRMSISLSPFLFFRSSSLFTDRLSIFFFFPLLLKNKKIKNK